MAFDFPNSPTVGQIFQGYTWDGEKWLQTMATPNTGGVVAIQVFTASGTYTPSANMVTCVIECQGGGGGGGGVAGAASSMLAGGGGGSGGYSRTRATAAQIGSLQTVTIGAAGAAAATGNNPGGAGGDTSVGTLCVAKGAPGGLGGGSGFCGSGGSGGAAGTGDFTVPGNWGHYVSPLGVVNATSSGRGANSMFGYGGNEAQTTSTAVGRAAGGYGAGGSGAGAVVAGNQGGGAGSPGIAIITEYGITTLGSSANAAGAVRFDVAQGLTSSQQTQGRSNIYAAPFDALAYSGMQINGSCEVSQELGSNNTGSVANTAKYMVDGWQVNCSGTMALTGLQSTAGPPGYSYFAQAVATTAAATIGASDYAGIVQPLEGYRWSRLGFGYASASPVSIGFWAMANRTGTYSVALRANYLSPGRGCAQPFTINTSATWEYKTVTFPGDVTGAWKYDNTLAVGIWFVMAAGTSLQATAGVWTAATPAPIAVTGQSNNVLATTDFLRITGVVVLPGIELPSSLRAPLIMRPYDQELITCKRYWEQGITIWYGYGAAAGFIGGNIYFKASKRANPTLTKSNFANAANCTTGFLDTPTPDAARHLFTVTATGAASATENWVADARL